MISHTLEVYLPWTITILMKETYLKIIFALYFREETCFWVHIFHYYGSVVMVSILLTAASEVI
jgi:hypothetical protein